MTYSRQNQTNTGGSYACKQVIHALSDYSSTHKVQPYHAYPTSLEAGDLLDLSTSGMAGMLNVQPGEVYFGPSTSQNTLNLAQAIAAHLAPGR